MGPKGKKGSGGKGKGGSGGVVDGVSTTEMTREQLEQHCNRLRSEMEREREERNFFQLERDKLRTFWEITRQQLQESRAELRNKDRELEEKEEYHQGQTKVFKQKVKHLLYEHQNKISELRAENMVSLKLAQEDFNDREQALLADKKFLKEKLLEQEKRHEEAVRHLKMEFCEKLSQTRKEFETQCKEIELRYEKLVETQKNEFNLRHKMELTEVDERKNKQISDLMKNHEKAFTDMRIYYNDITLNNLALISSLKEQMAEIKKKEERMEKSLKEVQKENKQLTEPMRKAREESLELTRQLTNYSKDKLSFANTKKILHATQTELESLKWDYQVLESKLEECEEEKQELANKLISAVLEVQQKAGLRCVLLEKKLKSFTDLLEQRETQFAEVLSLCDTHPSTLSALNNKVEDLLNRKNAAIQDLECELARVCKAHNDLLETYEAKLLKYDIPKEELGFNPLRTPVPTRKGPAGLVTLNKTSPPNLGGGSQFNNATSSYYFDPFFNVFKLSKKN